MAAVPIGFERWEPGHPWGDVVYDDGTKTSVSDPDGSIEAEATQMGARFNSMPKVAPEATPQPSLTGAAAPPMQPSTPSPAVPPPAPAADRVSGAARAAAPAPAPVMGQPAAPVPAQPMTPPVPLAATPGTAQSPTARAIADQGIDPNQLRAPAQQSPAERAVATHAPQLFTTNAEVSSEGPDKATQSNVQSASDAALQLRGKAINQQTQAGLQNLQDQRLQASVDYLRDWPKVMAAQAAEADAQKSRDDAAARLARVKSQPLDNHPDFPEWMVVSSLLGGIAGGFNQGFTGGSYKSTTVDNLRRIVSDWAENQRYNKSNLLSSLEEQLGDKNAALTAAKAGFATAIANQADAQSRYARTVQAQRDLAAIATAHRADALDNWAKTQTTVMGKESEKASMGFGIQNEVTQQLLGMGITPDAYAKGLETKVGTGENGGTLNQAIDKVLQVDQDKATLSSLAAANQGVLPGKGVIKIPESLVSLASKLGIRQGMDAEQVRQIYQEYLVKNAKAMGSRVNPQELEISGKTLGETTQSFLRELDRIRNETDESIKSAAEQAWPGFGQQVLDLHRRATAAIRGIPQVNATPFETTNGPEAPPAPDKPPMENPELHITSEEQQRLDAENAAIKLQEEKGRREREAEVKRRRERPIPGTKF